MKLAFYKIDNTCGYGRHTFDRISDKPEEILKELSRLGDDELRIYDTSVYGYGSVTPTPNLADFEDDYNDEVIDGSGWWCIVIVDKC